VNKFFNLLKKDTKELITVQLLIPIIIVIAMYSTIGNIMGSEMERATRPQQIAVVDFNGSALSNQVIDMLEKSNFIAVETGTFNVEDSINFARKKGINILVAIPENFEEDVVNLKQPEVEIYSIMKGLSVRETGTSTQVEAVFNVISNAISTNLITQKFTGIPPDVIKQPIKARDIVVVKDRMAQASPALVAQSAMNFSIFIPIILMLVTITSSQMIASLIALEKQNKTLETLLTVPVNRNFILLSKMVSAAIVAIIVTAAYLFAMTRFLGISQGPQASSDVMRALGLTLTTGDFLLLGISIFFAILSVLAVSTILAVYSEDEKSAQLMLTPLMVFVMIPYFLTIFTDVNTLSMPLRVLVYAIPFSHTFLATNNLMFGNVQFVIYGIIYQIIFSFVCILIATRIFSSDRLLTGRLRLARRRV
jgi:ABC-2 type transport system permease protein